MLKRLTTTLSHLKPVITVVLLATAIIAQPSTAFPKPFPAVTGAASLIGKSRRSSGGLPKTDYKPRSLSPKDRAELFDQVWNLVNEKYYDPTFHGVNWANVRDQYRPRLASAKSDSEFYSLLARMVGELHDAHTRFETPLSRQEREKEERLSAGVDIRLVDGKNVVAWVEPNSEAEKIGVKPGMELLAVNGERIDERLNRLRYIVAGSSSDRAEQLRLYNRILGAEPGEKLDLELREFDGRIFHASLMMRMIPDKASVTTKLLTSGELYLRISLWEPPAYDLFKRALDDNKSAPGLIIDLRGNPGGEAGEVLKVAGLLFDHKQSFGSFISRSGKASNLTADGRTGSYIGPIAILVDESSGSGSELFSAVMQEARRATVIGRRSCGCLLGISRFKKLKGGGDLAISELGYLSPAGRKIEGHGVTPDVTVPLTIADLRDQRDRALLSAQRELAAKNKPAG